jgi:hypothetical protein
VERTRHWQRRRGRVRIHRRGQQWLVGVAASGRLADHARPIKPGRPCCEIQLAQCAPARLSLDLFFFIRGFCPIRNTGVPYGAFATSGSATSSRNPIRGPAYRNLDLAVMRRVPLSGASALELRAEVFNVTNTPPFLAPNTTVGSAAFGTIAAAGDPRVVQLAVKLLF